MKKVVWALCAASVSLLFAPSARADDKADIRALYAKIEKAFKTRDTKAIMSMATPDFTEKVGNQVFNAKQVEAQMRQEFAATKEQRDVEMKPDKIDVKGSKAVVLANDKMNSVVVDQQGQMGPKGATHTIAG